MPEPVSTIFLITSALAAGVSAYSSIQQGKAAKQAGEYNAALEEKAANQARNSAEYEIERTREKYRRIRGSQVSSAAKSGVILDRTLSPIFLDTALTEDLDVLSELYKGAVVSGQHLDSARLSRMQGSAAKKSGALGAAGSIFGGIGSIVKDYPKIQ